MPVVPSIRVLTLSLVWLLVAPPLPAGENPPATDSPPATTGKADSRMAPFDELLSKFVAEHKIPGAALAVSRNGRLVYTRGFGYADVEAKSPVEPEALFRIASISKPITAVAILTLVEQGKLGLDERAFDRLGDDRRFTAHGTPDARLAQITIRQLLQHTAGWDRDVSFDPMFRPLEIARTLSSEPPAGPADVIRYMRGQPLDFQPGERYAYSNFGYCLLGRLIEKASGEAYDAYVQEHVLKPLGISRMQLGKTLLEGRAAAEVRYYEPGNRHGPAVVGPQLGHDVPLPYGTWYLEAMDAHGGWIASAVDLVRFASAFDDPRACPILKAETIAEMFARPAGLAGHDPEGKPKPVHYGLGWSVRPTGYPCCPVHWHTGSLDGTSTILVHRNDGLTWAMLFNTRNGAAADKAPARLIDSRLHEAADKVRDWPEGTAFGAQ